MTTINTEPDPHAIAVIGMAARFPQAKNIDEYWKNLERGQDCITYFTDDELRKAGVSEDLITSPSYIKARGIIEGIDLFDPNFFGITPSEARLMDPQQRIFLELCWEALEISGYSAIKDRSIGVYAGMSDSTYLNNNLLNNKEITNSKSPYQISIATSNHFLATKISYFLNLTGPSIIVNSACSTSLVAIIEACKSLLNYECELALAGGIAIRVPQIKGYLHQEGGIYSSDGTCRAFDSKSSGIVGSNGGGVVVLKRLEDAVKSGDTIDAVIRSSAINNDGATKIGYTAPSIIEQAKCIAMALSSIDAESISYIETHGTGTKLGDPIEIAALTKAFRHYTTKKNYCAIGSVKTNIGHTDVAAGIAGFIKTVLALKHKIIPASLYFNEANPEIKFIDSPFYVNAKTCAWDGAFPRRAGVSSFGIGGTNAHLLLEEAPYASPQKISQACFIIPLSAKSEEALLQQQNNLLHYVQNHVIDKTALANIAYTLQVGRQVFSHRKLFICKDVEELISLLQSDNCHQIHPTTNQLADKWLVEGHIDWTLVNTGAKLKRVPLPTYPFERKSHWVSPSLTETEQFSRLEIYQPYWEFNALVNKRTSESTNWLIFSDKLGISKTISSHLQTLNKHVIEIKKGKNFRQISPNCFELNPSIKENYRTLFDVLYQENKLPDSILYCWGLITKKDKLKSEICMDNIQDNDFISLTYFSQVFLSQAANMLTHLYIITNYLAKILPEDEIFPEQSLVLGTASVIPQEFSATSTVIDIGCLNEKITDVNLIINDCMVEPSASFIAYRNNLRFTQQFKSYELLDAPEKAHLKKEGVYLLTGGLGKIGLKLASYLASHYKAHLILTTRSATPYMKFLQEQEKSSDPLILQLLNIKKWAGSLVIMKAKVEDSHQMCDVFKYIKETHKRLNGLFHLAAVVDNSARVLITDLTIDQIKNQWLAKIAGVNVLAKLVNEKEIDFCLLFSSISAVVGGVGLSAYSAANNYLNYFADRRALANETIKWFSMSWDAWQHSVSKNKRTDKNRNFKNSIGVQQGMEVIQLYFNKMERPNLFISFNKLDSLNKSMNPTLSRHHSILNAKVDISVRQILQQLFTDCLGKEKIDPDVGFYDLGGDSLATITLLELIEEKFSIRISLTNFLENQSINQLAEIIETNKRMDTSFVINLKPDVITSKSLFLIHPISGTAFCYFDLINFLPHYSCYALQDPGLSSNEFNYESLEEMASAYLIEIKRKQPQGPYLLGGYSFGATLAFEIARQLRSNNEQIENIFIIDGWALFSKELHDKKRFNKAMQRTLAELVVRMPSVLQDQPRLLKILWKRMQLLLTYKPLPLSMDLTLFKAQEILPEYQSINTLDNHWSLLTTKSVQIYKIAGNHSNILDLTGAKHIGKIISDLIG